MMAKRNPRGMKCDQCGGRTSVDRTRPKVGRVVRTRRCDDPACGYVYLTVERRVGADPEPLAGRTG